MVRPTRFRFARHAQPRIQAFGEPGIEREHIVLLGFLLKRGLQLLELVWILRGEVDRLTEVFLDVVKLPWRLGEVALASSRDPGGTEPAGRDPAVEVLRYSVG
jgi:hypothetical protein